MPKGKKNGGDGPPEVILELINQDLVKCGEEYYRIVKNEQGVPQTNELGYWETVKLSTGELSYIEVTGVPSERELRANGYVSGSRFTQYKEEEHKTNNKEK